MGFRNFLMSKYLSYSIVNGKFHIRKSFVIHILLYVHVMLKSQLTAIRGGGGEGLPVVCGRPILAFSSALAPQTLRCLVCVEDA